MKIDIVLEVEKVKKLVLNSRIVYIYKFAGFKIEVQHRLS